MSLFFQLWTSKPASLEVQAVLQCNDEEALQYLKNFYGVMSTSSQYAAYTSGIAMHVHSYGVVACVGEGALGW